MAAVVVYVGCSGEWRWWQSWVAVVVVDGLRWLRSVVVVVEGDSGCFWRLWWRVPVVVVHSVGGDVGGVGSGGVP